jgi:hypothetical protein
MSAGMLVPVFVVRVGVVRIVSHLVAAAHIVVSAHLVVATELVVAPKPQEAQQELTD